MVKRGWRNVDKGADEEPKFTFGYNNGTRISDTEAFSRLSADEYTSLDGTVETRIAHNDVILWLVVLCQETWRGHDGYHAARQTLTHIVVWVTVQVDVDTCGQKGTERLAGVATQANLQVKTVN